MTASASWSTGSSVSCGSLVAEAPTSGCSKSGGLDDSEEVELGNLEWPRNEKVGVSGVEHSEAVAEWGRLSEFVEAASFGDILLSEFSKFAEFLTATSFGSMKGRIIVEIPSRCFRGRLPGRHHRLNLAVCRRRGSRQSSHSVFPSRLGLVAGRGGFEGCHDLGVHVGTLNRLSGFGFVAKSWRRISTAASHPQRANT